MRKLLTCTTALSLALSPISGLPARAQTLAGDGSVIGPDGSVLCTPSADAPCDLDAITAQLRAEAEAAAQAEAEAAAAAQAEAEAAAAAQAEADAAAAAQAEAEAAAAAQAEAEAAAAAQAEAEAAAAAQAEAAAAAAAQAEAEAAAAEQAEAEAKAALEAQAAADAAAAEPAAEPTAEPTPAAPVIEPVPEAVIPDATAPVEQPVTTTEPAVEPAPDTATTAPEITPVPEVLPEAAPDTAVEAAPETTPEAAPETAAPETAAEPVPDATAEVPPETTAEPVVEPAPEAVAEGAVPAPAAATEPVDVPEVTPEAQDSLAGLLAIPSATDGAVTEEGLAAAAAAATAVVDPETQQPLLPVAPAGDTATTAPAPTEPVSVTSEVVSDLTTRASSEDFAAAPTATADRKKKSGLSDLEKVGLVALGALVVGTLINQGQKDEKRVVEATGDRVVVQNPDGTYSVYKDDDTVLRRPGVRTVTETYRDGSTRTVVQRPDGSQVATVRDASGRVLRRSVYDRSGIETVLIDDLYPEDPIIISDLPRPKPGRVTISTSDDDAALKAELAALDAQDIGRKFSLRQIRDIPQVRALAAMIEVDTITFESGSAVIRETEARKLAQLGKLMQNLLADHPNHVFLIEGHTDAVGSAASNLLLSDRRAESLALALTEYFEIPPENLVVQGYGESELKVDSAGDERANRRVVVRLITPLMRTADMR